MSAVATGIEIVACTPYDLESQRFRFPSIEWLSDDETTRDRALRSSDLWLGLGDTPFQLASGPWLLDDLLRNCARCAALRIPMVFLGVGCESWAAVSDERARAVIDIAERIWTRDAFSAELLARVAASDKVVAGADLANIAIAAATPPAPEAGLLGLLLGLDVRETVDVIALENALASRASGYTRWIVQEARSFPCTELWNYHALSEWTQSRVGLMPLDYTSCDIATFLRAFGTPETLLSSRYHGALVGAWFGSRVALVARSGKLASAAADLDVPSLARIEHARDIEALVAGARLVDPARLAFLRTRAEAMSADFARWLGALAPRGLDVMPREDIA